MYMYEYIIFIYVCISYTTLYIYTYIYIPLYIHICLYTCIYIYLCLCVLWLSGAWGLDRLELSALNCYSEWGMVSFRTCSSQRNAPEYECAFASKDAAASVACSCKAWLAIDAVYAEATACLGVSQGAPARWANDTRCWGSELSGFIQINVCDTTTRSASSSDSGECSLQKEYASTLLHGLALTGLSAALVTMLVA